MAKDCPTAAPGFSYSLRSVSFGVSVQRETSGGPWNAAQVFVQGHWPRKQYQCFNQSPDIQTKQRLTVALNM